MGLSRRNGNLNAVNRIAVVRIVIRTRFGIYAVQIHNAVALAYAIWLVDCIFHQAVYVQRQNRDDYILVIQRVDILVFAGAVVILA